ncbi:MAG: DUF5071 domain-containing protein [Pseudomonadales bacterium]
MPADKFDLEACKRLAIASDDDVIKNISELLEWIQDMNWPVASPICDRLSKIGSPVVPHIKKILLGTDETWKYFVISGLVHRSSEETILSLRPILNSIVEQPTGREEAEEVNIVAMEVLAKCS